MVFREEEKEEKITLHSIGKNDINYYYPKKVEVQQVSSFLTLFIMGKRSKSALLVVVLYSFYAEIL